MLCAGNQGRDAGVVSITLNGERHSLPGPLTVRGLVRRLGLDEDTVAIERNRRIVARADWRGVPVGAGDRIEIVHFVGGG